MDHRQRTLRNQVECTGLGLHSGERVDLKIRPAAPDTGIRFVRTDCEGQPVVDARFQNVVDTTLATTIACNGCRISTIEHLMAAFFGLGIDNALVEVNGPEVPIMDGSAAPFVFLLKSGGIMEHKIPKRFIVIKKPFHVRDAHRSISIFPSKELKITYTIDFEHPMLRNQTYDLSFTGGDFVRKISRARTFGFLKDVEMLKENGFAKGGSLDNAVVIDDFRILNEDGLRFKNEFVRHKILDFIGDISLVGRPIIGHFVVKRSGHFLNQHVLAELMESPKHWRLLSFESLEEWLSTSVKIPSLGLAEPAHA